MSDYRQVPLKFLNAGLDLTLPPESIDPSTWRRLDNIRILKDTVMEGRMHTANFLTSSYFTPYTYENISLSGKTYSIEYPTSYAVGPLVYMAYVGELFDGTPAYLTIHEQPNADTWPYIASETWPTEYFSCFINGIPLVQMNYRGYKFPGHPTQQTYPSPLTVSSNPPSVVRMLAPSGPGHVLIDGRWRLVPSNVDPDNLSTLWNGTNYSGGLQFKVYAHITAGGSGYEWVTLTFKPFYVSPISNELSPYNVLHSTYTQLSAAATTTTGSLTVGTYNYLATYKNKKSGTRSIATGASSTVTINATNPSALVTAYYPCDPQNDQIEIWRRGGNIGNSYRLVTTLSAVEGAGIYPNNLSSVTHNDTVSDASIALNEALDPLLVKPFPTVDRAGLSYSLLSVDPAVYALGTCLVAQSTSHVTGNLTSGGGAAAALWTEGYKGLAFRWGDTSTGEFSAPYTIINVTAATTAAAAKLVLDTTVTFDDVATSMSYLIERDMPELTSFGPFLGQYVFWIGDPVKKANFYWSNQGKPNLSTADLNYNTITDPGEELVNGIMYGSSPIVFSKRKAYTFDYGGPEATPAFVPRELPIGLGLSAKHGLAATRAGVFFVHVTGIYLTDGQGAPTLLSKGLQPLFLGDTVDSYTPIDWANADSIRLCATTRELHFFYPDTSGDVQHLVYDLQSLGWSRWTGGFTYAYELEEQNKHVLVLSKAATSSIYYMDDSTRQGTAETFSCYARTASWDSGIPLTDKEFGVLMLDFDPDGTAITITPRYNSDTSVGTPFVTTTTAGRRIETFSLKDQFKRSISFEFSWEDNGTNHPQLYLAQILFRADEEGMVHWYLPPTSFSIPGWFHAKDAYITLKSTAAVTLTLSVDGVETNYSIASTGGEKVRNYVEFGAFRGKLMSIKMESTAPFYFYGEESQLLVKPWKTGTQYKPVNAFQPAGYAEYLRNEGGT